MVLINTLPGFEEFEGYGITSCGKVWSFKRNKFLTPYRNYKGYLYVHLSNRQKSTSPRIHKLVALAYIPNPDNLETVDHIDGIKEHNYINNLQWMTRADNKRKSCCKKVMCVETGEIFESGAVAGKALGVNPTGISQVCNGKLNKTGGYSFKFV